MEGKPKSSVIQEAFQEGCASYTPQREKKIGWTSQQQLSEALWARMNSITLNCENELVNGILALR